MDSLASYHDPAFICAVRKPLSDQGLFLLMQDLRLHERVPGELLCRQF